MSDFTTALAADKWATFSGDWNPIHFDLRAARQLGADRLVVHGMLALLKVKQETSSRLAGAHGASSCQQFSAYFRLPALQGSMLELDVRSKTDGANFTLHADEQLCVRGHHTQVANWLDASAADGTAAPRFLDAQTVAAKSKLFRALFPAISHPWIFLDALVFSDFLRDHFQRESPQSTGFLPVQMSHRVRFQVTALDKLSMMGSRPSPVQYTVHRIEGPNEDADRFGIAVLTVRNEAGPLMKTEIGLLAKRINNDGSTS